MTSSAEAGNAPGLPLDTPSSLAPLAHESACGAGIPLVGSARHMMLRAYAEWLHNERSILCHMMGWNDAMVMFTAARRFHYPNVPGSWRNTVPPTARATIVMDAVGVDLTELRAWAQQAADAADAGIPWPGSQQP